MFLTFNTVFLQKFIYVPTKHILWRICNLIYFINFSPFIIYEQSVIRSIPDKSTSAKKKAALQKLSPSWLPRVYTAWYAFRIIETDSTSVDESVSTSLVSMHIPYEIFAISARSNRMVHRGAISAEIKTIVSRVETNAADLWLLTFDVPRSHRWESGKKLCYVKAAEKLI